MSGTVIPTDGTSFEENSTVDFAATANTGWVFSRWEGDLSGTDNPTRVDIVSDLEATAVFEVADPPAGYIAFYPFNGNADDESADQHDGVVSGASLVQDRFGNGNSAYAFDGVDDVITVPHSAGLDVGQSGMSYSLSLWVQSTQERRSRIVQKWNEEVTVSFPFSLRSEPDDFNGALYGGGFLQIVSVGSPWDGEWHHVVYVVDSSADLVSMYVDGNLEGSQVNKVDGPTNNSVDIYIGGGPRADRRYAGLLDDIVIYDRALSGDEVSSLYHAGGWGL